jgi:anti-anti-sigma factor
MMLTGQIKVTDLNGVPVASLEGEIDIANAAQLRAQLTAAVPNTASRFIIDLTPTSYLDSRGVHLILEVAERAARGQQLVRLVVPSDSHVYRILQFSRVQDAVPIDATVEDAVRAITNAHP